LEAIKGGNLDEPRGRSMFLTRAEAINRINIYINLGDIIE
jgi:hypothetical protein